MEVQFFSPTVPSSLRLLIPLHRCCLLGWNSRCHCMNPLLQMTSAKWVSPRCQPKRWCRVGILIIVIISIRTRLMLATHGDHHFHHQRHCHFGVGQTDGWIDGTECNLYVSHGHTALDLLLLKWIATSTRMCRVLLSISHMIDTSHVAVIVLMAIMGAKPTLARQTIKACVGARD